MYIKIHNLQLPIYMDFKNVKQAKKSVVFLLRGFI